MSLSGFDPVGHFLSHGIAFPSPLPGLAVKKVSEKIYDDDELRSFKKEESSRKDTPPTGVSIFHTTSDPRADEDLATLVGALKELDALGHGLVCITRTRAQVLCTCWRAVVAPTLIKVQHILNRR